MTIQIIFMQRQFDINILTLAAEMATQRQLERQDGKKSHVNR